MSLPRTRSRFSPPSLINRATAWCATPEAFAAVGRASILLACLVLGWAIVTSALLVLS